MDSKKKTYPRGIYANRTEKVPSFVRSNVKIDNAKAIEWLQSQTAPYTHLQILESHQVDEYNNTVYICVDDYQMERQREKASEGLKQANQVLQQQSAKPDEDELPLPQFGHKDETAEDDIPF
jgi:hypothetical protein